MKKILLVFIIIQTFSKTHAQTTIFNDLLQKHVTNEGVVDYKKFNGPKLKKYLNYLEKTTVDISWSNNKKKAFWINAYNAYTIYLIIHALNTEKIKSITDIKKEGKTAWKIPFVNVGGIKYSLDYIEHEILRKTLFDPRIHVGVNCASGSCPKLGNTAFTEENIEATLEQLMKDFINDTSRNKISKKKVQISSIFNWFQKDFTNNSSLIDYLNKYSETKINSNAKISYLKYDWSLNGK
jgi:predicted nucleic-acid-binding Zn-ribbon protein